MRFEGLSSRKEPKKIVEAVDHKPGAAQEERGAVDHNPSVGQEERRTVNHKPSAG